MNQSSVMDDEVKAGLLYQAIQFLMIYHYFQMQVFYALPEVMKTKHLVGEQILTDLHSDSLRRILDGIYAVSFVGSFYFIINYIIFSF